MKSTEIKVPREAGTSRGVKLRNSTLKTIHLSFEAHSMSFEGKNLGFFSKNLQSEQSSNQSAHLCEHFTIQITSPWEEGCPLFCGGRSPTKVWGSLFLKRLFSGWFPYKQKELFPWQQHNLYSAY